MNKQIIVTLGPTSLKKDIIRKMDNSGADYFRINLSHTDIEEYDSIFNKVRALTSKPVCPDTEGAQLRTGLINTKNGSIKLNENDQICFVNNKLKLKNKEIPISNYLPYKVFKLGDLVKIDFDSVLIHINKVEKRKVYGKVLEGGVISSNKGIAIDRDLDLPCFTKKDIKVFKLSNKLQINTVFLSFCSQASDIIQLRKYFNYPINVIAKIENKAGLNNLIEICDHADGILIDRGDLSRDVPLEKIPFAQEKILRDVKSTKVPVYIATNLMENMIYNSKPTRAEISDIVTSLKGGAKGLVLAAETAIGKYPVECVRIMSRIINEVDNKIANNNELEYLFSLPSDRMILPHGGKLVQQYVNKSEFDFNSIPILSVNENIAMDVEQIACGVYSPINGFMNSEELLSVLVKNILLSGTVWTLPILFQLKKNQKDGIQSNSIVALKRKGKQDAFAVIKIDRVQKINHPEKICKLWFTTEDTKHPGVFYFLNSGNYLISGRPYLIKENCNNNSVLTPAQTRDIFNYKGWHNIISFHTRNIIHRGHGFIQKKALEETNADGIYISPVIGSKKKGDFKSEIIIKSYETLINDGYYNPYGVIVNPFNTFSRYSGPREAVFTALCRKNYGCNYFIVGRDHTGVGEYYHINASRDLFESLGIGMEILFFDQAYYNKNTQKVTDKLFTGEQSDALELSGTKIRESLRLNSTVPDYLLENSVKSLIESYYSTNPNHLFIK